MFRICAICGKGPLPGKKVVRKGLLKKKGGTGSKIVRSTKRKFLPNLQKLRIILNGKTTKAYVCTKCLKKGLVQKAI
ncbi:MAG: 50S ribosomal protein L28 [Candidatus Omnitrophica bacterium]|nr:50S ribosomal protein L28 [Candidatus Omnitrophota bacterium]